MRGMKTKNYRTSKKKTKKTKDGKKTENKRKKGIVRTRGTRRMKEREAKGGKAKENTPSILLPRHNKHELCK